MKAGIFEGISCFMPKGGTRKSPRPNKKKFDYNFFLIMFIYKILVIPRYTIYIIANFPWTIPGLKNKSIRLKLYLIKYNLLKFVIKCLNLLAQL